MKRSFLVHRALIVLTAMLAILIAGMPLGPVAAQADATSYTTQLTGDVVRTSGPWTIDMETTGAEAGTEVVGATGQFGGVLISWLPSGTDLVEARDYMLDELGSFFDTIVPIDKGAYGSVSYSLDLSSTEGIEFGVFSLFLGERSSGYVEYYLYMGPVATFRSGFDSAQQNITVGGTQIFENVDGAGLQEFLNQHVGEAGGAATQPDTNVASSTTGQESPAPTEETGGAATTDADESAYIQTLRGEVDYLQASLDDFITYFPALQGDDSDMAVQEITRVSNEWLDYADRADAIIAPAGYEEIDAKYRLLADDVGIMGQDWLQFLTLLGQGADTEQAIDTFIDDMDAVQQDLDQLSALLDSQALEGNAPTEVVTETPVPAVISPTATATSTSTKGSTRGPAGGLTVAGNESETGKGDQAGQSGQAANASDYANLGLIEDGQYLSPQHGVGLAWDENWYFDDTITEPIVSDTSTGIDTVTISSASYPGASIFVTIASADGVTPADFLALWTSADYLESNADPNAAVLSSDTSRSGSVALLMREYLSDGTEYISIRSAACADSACETLVLTTMIGLPDTFADAYRDARSGVDVEGARLIEVLSPREVSGAIGR